MSAQFFTGGHVRKVYACRDCERDECGVPIVEARRIQACTVKYARAKACQVVCISPYQADTCIQMMSGVKLRG